MFDLLWNLIRALEGLKRRFLPTKKSPKLGKIKIDSLGDKDAPVVLESCNVKFTSTICGVTETFAFQARRARTYQDAIIDLQSGVILDGNNEILADCSPWGKEHLLLNRLPSMAFPVCLIPRYDRKDCVLKLSSVGYYHYLLEELPSLLHLLTLYPEKPVLIAENAPKYLIQSAAELRLEIEIVKPLVKVKNVSYLTHHNSTGWPHPKDIQMMRDTFGYLLQAEGPPKDRVYVSRRNSSRSPKFEGNLELLLRSAGWQIVFAEEIDFFQQIKTFSRAKVVMGIHGAGLANAIWMNPKATLIEFIPLGRPLCYERISRVLGLQYYGNLLANYDMFQSEKIPDRVLEVISEFVV